MNIIFNIEDIIYLKSLEVSMMGWYILVFAATLSIAYRSIVYLITYKILHFHTPQPAMTVSKIHPNTFTLNYILNLKYLDHHPTYLNGKIFLPTELAFFNL